MSLNKWVFIGGLMLLAGPTLKGQNLEKSVFKVVNPGNKEHPELVGTGFLFRSGNIRGIVTSLHLVANGKYLAAYYRGQSYTDLEIKYVDIAHDIALLYSDALPSDGLIAAVKLPQPGKIMKVVGYPDDMKGVNQKTVSIGTPSIKKLSDMLPGNARDYFITRNSPAPADDILYVEGQMGPGHSGAPLLDEQNLVYGVICGGVREGAAGITWAIPINSVEWRNMDSRQVQTQVNALQAIPGKYRHLYGFEKESDDSESPTIPAAFDITGTWKMTMRESHTLLSDGTDVGGHWMIGGILTLTKNNNSVTGKFSSRNWIDMAMADITGTVNGENVELRIVSTKGGCFGSGFVIKARIAGQAIRGRNEPLDNRPPRCHMQLSEQLTLERN